MGRRIGSLGFNVKRLQGNNLLSGGSIIIGSTTGAGSSTRKYQYCIQRSKNPSLCINQVVNFSNYRVNPLYIV
jgi:hypothetical protein